MSIIIKTNPTIDIAELEQATGDRELLSRAFCDCVDALARYAIVGRTAFHATVLLHDLREQLEKGIKP